MKRVHGVLLVLGTILCADMTMFASRLWAATPSEVFKVWPEGKKPGQGRVNPTKPEYIISDRRRPFYQIADISEPTVSVFLAPEEKRTGASVFVCPGGGMQRLAYEHEGLEIADWLNPLGISVFVLKYNVPGPSATALLDAQRGMGLIRKRAAEFKIDSERIGTMGFSAGGEVALLLAVNFKERGYEAIDDADKLPCRPTNACLVYAGGIARGGELRQDITSKLDSKTTPTMFIAHAFGDASDNSLALAWQLKQSRIPCEVHIYQEGGHGFGARDSGLPLNGWKASYVQWLSAQGFLDKPYLGPYADHFAASVAGSEPLKRLSTGHKDVTLADAYAVQRRVVRQQLAGERLAGFKAGASNALSQKTLGVDKPITGILFRGGRLDAKEGLVVENGGKPQNIVVETEIGYIVSNGVDISTRINTVEHIKGAFEAVLPVIEIPANMKSRMDGELSAADSVAANIGSARFIVGRTKVSPDDINPDDLKIKLQRDGKTLHEATGNLVVDGQWKNLITVVNQIVDRGYTLHGGDLVICGALGAVHPGETGKYHAEFGPLGSIDFEIK